MIERRHASSLQQRACPLTARSYWRECPAQPELGRTAYGLRTKKPGNPADEWPMGDAVTRASSDASKRIATRRTYCFESAAPGEFGPKLWEQFGLQPRHEAALLAVWKVLVGTKERSPISKRAGRTRQRDTFIGRLLSSPWS